MCMMTFLVSAHLIWVSDAKDIGYGAVGGGTPQCNAHNTQACNAPPSNNYGRGCEKGARCRDHPSPPGIGKDIGTPPGKGENIDPPPGKGKDIDHPLPGKGTGKDKDERKGNDDF